MAKKFHIGIRVDEIIKISRNENPEYPTRFYLRSGHEFNTTGEWRDNIAAVESLLELDDSEAHALEVRLHELRVAIEAHERVLAKMEAAGPMKDDDGSLLAKWLGSGRYYLVAHEREALTRLVAALKEGGPNG